MAGEVLAREGVMSDEYRYAAFISYRHTPADRKWAAWLHKALETYRTPAPLVKRGTRARVGKIFRDEEELSASADLSARIDEALQQSEYLIVVCSPETPKSRWVNAEIERFRVMGREERILALLVDGDPESAFPLALLDKSTEPLAADVRQRHDYGRAHAARDARLRLASTLLGVSYDDLRNREQRRRQSRLIMAVVTLSAATIAFAAVGTWALQQRSLAVDRLVEADRQRADAVASLDFLTNNLLAAADPMVTRGRIVTARDLLDQTAAQVDESFRSNPSVRGAIHLRLARMLENLGESKQSLHHAQRATESFLESPGDTEEWQIASRNAEAIAMMSLGSFSLSHEVHKEVLRRSSVRLGPDHPGTMNSLKNNAFVLYRLNRSLDAEPLARAAVEGYRRAAGTDATGTLSAIGVYANIIRACGRLADSLFLYRYCAELHRRADGDDHVGTMLAEGNIILCLLDDSQFESAAKSCELLLAKQARVLGEKHLFYATTLRELARADLGMNRPHEALTLAKKALSIAQARIAAPYDRRLQRFAEIYHSCLIATNDGQRAAVVADEFHLDLTNPPSRLAPAATDDVLSNREIDALISELRREYEALMRSPTTLSADGRL